MPPKLPSRSLTLAMGRINWKPCGNALSARTRYGRDKQAKGLLEKNNKRVHFLMSRKSDWNLSKGSKVLSSFCIASGSCLSRAQSFFTPKRDLGQVGELPLILYSIGFGLAFLVFGEMLGLSERRIIRFSVRRLILYFLAAFLASLASLLGVWVIEFSFVGRFAILKIALSTGLASFFLFWLFNSLARQTRTRIFLLASAESSQSLRSSISEQAGTFEWVDSEELEPGASWLNFAKMKKWT